MSFEYIRKAYDIPAEPGGRVEYAGSGKPEFGTITGTQGAHLLIALDGDETPAPFHPTWKLRYLDERVKLREVLPVSGDDIPF